MSVLLQGGGKAFRDVDLVSFANGTDQYYGQFHTDVVTKAGRTHLVCCEPYLKPYFAKRLACFGRTKPDKPNIAPSALDSPFSQRNT